MMKFQLIKVALNLFNFIPFYINDIIRIININQDKYDLTVNKNQ